jgi:coniferyl-aldehyde dehydrogenase
MKMSAHETLSVPAVPVPSAPAQVLALQQQAHARDPYPDLARRRDRLDRLLDVLKRGQGQLCAAIAADFGQRSADNSRLFDILPAVHAINYARKHLPAWMKPQRRQSSFPYNLLGGRSSTQAIPLGVVGNVSPWNFPVTLSLSPLGGILAAGNRVMLKPSELTPATAETLQTLIAAAFAPEEIAVVTGAADVAAEFTRLPFDHLLFTGSTAVGRKVAAAAAANLVPTTLELGGKSPVLVSATANLPDLAEKLLFAKTMNAGQICLAPDYVLVQADQVDTLVQHLRTAATRMFPQGLASPDYVNIISPRHVQRFRAYLTEAEAGGNTVIPLFGPEPAAHHYQADRRLAPCLVLMRGTPGAIMQEEIFGPLLPLVVVPDFAAALAQIQARSSPLALYYFGTDAGEIRTLQQRVRCGGMVVNDLLSHFLQDDLPFGGVGDSGMGAYHGYEGFERFSHKKAIFVAPRMDVGKLLRPPYGALLRRYLTFELGEK